ncbi:MAG: LacI family transcriptional regulator [Frankiaceae bacterium]|nr:LacI family transcriptional regulator [Frankiaceae bacterium]
MVDIREVARRSGVSPATVSRALNGRPDVSEATRERVRKTASDLGYLPNEQARTLVRRRSDTVGLIWDTSYVVTKGRHSFLQDLAVGLKIALAETGYHLMILSPGSTTGSEDAFVRIAAQHSLEGVALMAVEPHLPAVEALIASGRPCIGLDLPIRGRRASYVGADNHHGASLAVDHLVGLGHRRIAVITGPLDILPGVERHEGFRTQMAAHGLEVLPEYVVSGDFFIESGHAAMLTLLALPNPPTAVFACGDQMAVGAMHAINEAGLDVPGDISVVGFDDVEIAALVRPSLTTVSQDYLGLGRAAVELLSNLIAEDREFGRGADAPPSTAARRPELVPGALIVRDSTGPVPLTQGVPAIA